MFNHISRFITHSKALTVNLPPPSQSSLSPIILTNSKKKFFNLNKSETKNHNIDISLFSPIQLITSKSCSIPDIINRMENLKNKELFKLKSSKSFFFNIKDELLEMEERTEKIDVRKMEFDLKKDLNPKPNDLSSYKSIENIPSRFKYIIFLLFFI